MSQMVKILRKKRGITQIDLARRIGSSQSRVAKIEAGDPSVSIDLLVHTIYSLGATQQKIGYEMSRKKTSTRTKD